MLAFSGVRDDMAPAARRLRLAKQQPEQAAAGLGSCLQPRMWHAINSILYMLYIQLNGR